MFKRDGEKINKNKYEMNTKTRNQSAIALKLNVTGKSLKLMGPCSLL
jgi:hypothetical protein